MTEQDTDTTTKSYKEPTEITFLQMSTINAILQDIFDQVKILQQFENLH